MDAERGASGKQRPRPKVPWKFLTVLLVCISNSILTVVLWTLLIPLREEVKTLKTHEVQDGGIGVKAGAVQVNDGVSGVKNGVVFGFDDGYNFLVESDKKNEEQSDEHSLRDPNERASREQRSSNRGKKRGKKRRKKTGKKSGKKSGGKSTEKKSTENIKCKECKCSIQQVERTPCAKCCKRKVRRQAREDRERQLKDMQNNITALNDKIQKILVNGSIGKSLFVEAHNKLYESRLGQFVGINTPRPDCDNKIKNSDRILTTKDGRVCLWQYADWMSEDAKKLYRLDELQGRVSVTESGVYFIYGQLIQEDLDDYASASIVVSSGAKKPESLAQCSETAGYTTITDSLTHKEKRVESVRTCYMGVLAWLEVRAEVYIKLSTSGMPRKIWHVPETAYFGLIKFS